MMLEEYKPTPFTPLVFAIKDTLLGLAMNVIGISFALEEQRCFSSASFIPESQCGTFGAIPLSAVPGLSFFSTCNTGFPSNELWCFFGGCVFVSGVLGCTLRTIPFAAFGRWAFIVA